MGERCSPLPSVEYRLPAGLSNRDGPRLEGVRDCMTWPVNVGPGVEVAASTPSGANYLPTKAALGKSQTRGFRLPSIANTTISAKKPPINMESVGLALCGWPGSEELRNGDTQRMAEGTVLQNGELADYTRARLPPTSCHSLGSRPQHDFFGSDGNSARHKVSSGHHIISSANARVSMIGAKLELIRDGVRVKENGRPKAEDVTNHYELPPLTTEKQSTGDKPGAFHVNGDANNTRKTAQLTTGKILLPRKPRARLLQRVRLSHLPTDNMCDIMAHRYLSDYIERQTEVNKRRHLEETERLNAKRRAKLVRSNRTSELRANRPRVAPIPGQQRKLWKMSKFTKKAQSHFTTFHHGLTQSHCGKSAASGGSAGEMSHDGADTLSDGTPPSSLAETSPADAAHRGSAHAELSTE